MPANRIVTEAQERMLLNIMAENLEIANGRLITHNHNPPQAKQMTRELWEAVATQLNAMHSGTTKTWNKWRDYWTERKYAVRKKMSRIRSRMRDNEVWCGSMKLTECEEKVLQIMGEAPVIGEPLVQIPSDDQSDSVTLDEATMEMVDTKIEMVDVMADTTAPGAEPGTEPPRRRRRWERRESETNSTVPIENSDAIATLRLARAIQHHSLATEQKARASEQRARATEQKARAIEQQARATEQQARAIDHVANVIAQFCRNQSRSRRRRHSSSDDRES